jgi:uncharacterized protein YutE (UPF0331/DUF86 family)
MPLDKDFVIRKIKLIQEELAHLEKFSQYSFEEVASDYEKTATVERFLERIITRAIDINQHIISELGKGTETIRGYGDTFLALSDLGIYPKDFAEEIALSAGLRNRLVHEYDTVDQEIVYKSVSEALEQYASYSAYILKFIEKG